MDARLIAVLWAFLAAPALALDHSHAAWDALLKKHVVLVDGANASQLRYAAIAKERGALQQYLKDLSAVSGAQFEGWAAPQQMAFLINAYNAATVEKVLTRYPELRSIRDFGKVFGNPFRDEFFSLFGRRMSLDQLEHEILRKRYREPRVHFALNCASVGCPMLREEAYVGVHLERQLEEQARRFLSDRSRNRVRDGRLEVSKIFDWYQEDFEPRERFFGRFAGVLSDQPAQQKLVAEGKARISFLDYDWSLNDFRSSSPR
jgi:hypothetical protein